MELKIENLEEIRVIGFKETIKYKGAQKMIPAIWEKHSPTLFSKLMPLNDGKFKGVFGVNTNMQKETFDYYIATSSNESVEDLSVLTIPENTYAVFETTMEKIAETFNSIWKEWLPASNYEANMQAPVLEYYPSETRCIIYAPVKVK